MKTLLKISIVLCIEMFMACTAQVQDIYVSPNGDNHGKGTQESPLASIESALAKAEGMKKDNAEALVTIHVLEGEYRLDAPIKITPNLSRLNIVGEGLDKVFIKGSETLVLDWKKYNDNIWVATVGTDLAFDQLIVNGNQQILARYPNYNEEGGHWQGHAADAIAPERVKTWKDPKDAIVHAMHSGEWGGFHYQVVKANDDGALELTGGHQNNRPSPMHETYRMVENVFEELDSPGEWFFDKVKKQLYYWPNANVKLESAHFEGVSAKSLVHIMGEQSNPVKNVNISGISFMHTKRTIMEGYEPLLRSDWTIYRGGALFIEGAENVKISDCEFKNLGGNVVFVSNYNRNIDIERNHIHDCGATAISFVGDPKAVRSPSFQYGEFVPLTEMDTIKGPKTNNYPSKSIVNDNLIYRIGRVEKQTTGVEISMAMDITVSNNSIYDIPRAGINVSEGTWGGHIIEFNDVFNTVLETSDHGAFNSWGRDRFWHPNRSKMDEITNNNPEMPYWDAIHTTIIRNNRFRCDHGWDIDLDDGSSNYEIYNNLCLKGGIKLREGFKRTVENNVMVNNSFHPHVWFKNSEDVFRNNIVLTEYKDIRLQGWGKEVDYNFFPNQEALSIAQKNGTDIHSGFGDPLFVDAELGDFRVKDSSEALKVGFKNLPMDQFGVKTEQLKAMAKTPEIPVLWAVSNAKSKSIKMDWLGAEIKNIETMEERSAAGLNKTAGVLILSFKEKSILEKSGLKVGDVIVWGEAKEINAIPDLMEVHSAHNWKGKINLKVIRNQKENALLLLTK